MPIPTREDARRIARAVLQVEAQGPLEVGADATREGAPGEAAATLDAFEWLTITGAALGSGVAPGLVSLPSDATLSFTDRADVPVWVLEVTSAHRLGRGIGTHVEGTDRRGLYLTWPVGTGGGGGTTSPLTTKGDLWGFSTIDARVPIGGNGQVLTADSTQALGLKWAAAAGSGTVTSVGLSGGTTGLTVSGSPVTASGTMTLGGTLNRASGGTGSSAVPANGQILIGNGTDYTLATLTAGANITITNGIGTITIAATGTGTTILDGAGAPASGTGALGNYYEDTTGGIFYGPKTAPAAEERITVTSAPGSNDAGSWELGTRVKFNVAGQIVRLRYQRLSTSAATLTFHVWDDAGALLATVSDTQSGGAGAFEVALPTPLSVPLNAIRRCSVTAGASGNTPVNSVRQSVTNSTNCIFQDFRYASGTGTFPNTIPGAETYYVEPIFVPGTTWPVAVRQLGSIQDDGTTAQLTKRLATSGTSSLSLAATENSLAIGDAVLCACTPASGGSTINGIASGTAGRWIVLRNTGATDSITINHLNAGATSSNQVTCPGGAAFVLRPGQAVLLCFWQSTNWTVTLPGLSGQYSGRVLGFRQVAADESTSGTGYTDLTTVDEVTFTAAADLDALVIWSTGIYHDTAAKNCSDEVAYDNGSGYALDASTATNVIPDMTSGGVGKTMTLMATKSFTGTGLKKVKVQHSNINGGGNAHWRSRSLLVIQK